SFASPKESNKEKEPTKTNFNFFFHSKTYPKFGLKKLQFALFVDVSRTVLLRKMVIKFQDTCN
ncbi:MAG: hypothetical protein Q7W13_09975, partial [Bacteroidia bacterium]|nr:hypothetical protein [Bacteroidia bacterium]